ncbi:endoplasmic reticulum vesicle transporter-domain-containing protein [Syncephalis fuscata]|nr:endoplasmic reticulum vesicle transporter-domain-containing protein [Syncephalis fuscata]
MKCEYLIAHAVDNGGASSKINGHLQLQSKDFTADGATLLSDILNEETKNEGISHNDYNSGMSAFSMDKHGNSLHHAVYNDHSSEGCRLYGSFDAAKIAGNLHVTALGHGHGGGHVPHEAINFTHRIDRFSFGKEYPNLVPTIYQTRFSSPMFTNQYAVTEYHRAVNSERNIWPGVYFKYTLEPISVHVTEGDDRSLFNFLTRLCGVIGGIWVTTGLIYAVVNTLSNNNGKQSYTEVKEMKD